MEEENSKVEEEEEEKKKEEKEEKYSKLDINVKSYIDEKLAGLNYQLVNSAHSEANPYVASKLVSCILGDVLGR